MDPESFDALIADLAAFLQGLPREVWEDEDDGRPRRHGRQVAQLRGIRRAYQ